MKEVWLFALQRLTALVMAPLVIVHIGLIIYAVRGGLTGEEILGRTRGSVGWAVFYGLFVLTAAIHGGIGLRAVLSEWTPIRRTVVGWLSLFSAGIVLALGARAVYAVYIGGAPVS